MPKCFLLDGVAVALDHDGTVTLTTTDPPEMTRGPVVVTNRIVLSPVLWDAVLRVVARWQQQVSV